MVNSHPMKSSILRSRSDVRAAMRFLAFAGLFATAAGAAPSGTPREPFELTVDSDGFLTFPGGGIGVCAFFPGWATAAVRPDLAAAEEDAANIVGADAGKPFVVVRRDGSAAFRGRVSWTPQDDGTVLGVVRAVAQDAITMQCLALDASCPAPPPAGLGLGRAREYDIPCGGGRSLRFSFPEERSWYAQDSRQWGGAWTVRFGDERRLQSFAAGEVAEWRFVLSDPSGAPLRLSAGKPVEILPGDRWAPLEWHKDVEPGSALDFSGMRLQDAPAGKYGWLRAVGNRFEFEGLPGTPQRFYGANLCFTANYPDHALADTLVERFVRGGYNSVRIHHHDGIWKKAFAAREAGREGVDEAAGGRDDGEEPPVFAPTGAAATPSDDIDLLDYLLAKCYEAGIYVTTDLYVSRPVPWRDIGEDRDGNVPVQLYKTLIACHDGAFADWCRWAAAFLEHVNPYTGRAAKDEPGMPLLSLINEGALKMSFADKRDDPHVLAAWREFCGETESGKEPSCREEEREAPHTRIPSPGEPRFDEFSDWLSRRAWERCSAFVRALGCRALLTDDNNGGRHGKGCTPLYDYYDCHFYVDHPQFVRKPWKLPSRNLNLNPVRAGSPAMLHRLDANASPMPCVSSEWNFSGPGRYRGVGGILAGTLAASRGFDGLWRFAYSHQSANLVEGKGNMGYFDAVTDPLVSASDRAAVCLFLRGDGAERDALALDPERGAMSIATERTCGGFAESGRIDAGALSFELLPEGESAPVPAAIWASSLDGAPLAESSRILLVHLADVQGRGARYADETRQVLIKWGAGTLVEASTAEVTLAVSGETRDFAVFALDAAGRRVAEVPCEIAPALPQDPSCREGEREAPHSRIRFRVSTRAPDGAGRIFYEIARSPRPAAGGNLP